MRDGRDVYICDEVGNLGMHGGQYQGHVRSRQTMATIGESVSLSVVSSNMQSDIKREI